MTEHVTCRVERSGLVATVTLIPPASLPHKTSDLHWELGEVFSELRGDTSVRVVVLTGRDDEFYAARTKGFLSSEAARRYLCEPAGAFKTFTGVLRTHQCMVEMEKPILAKVNGNAIGFGCSLVLACDLIIVAEDAVLSDIHLGMGELDEGGPEHGLAPGDGGGALIPLFMSPPKAKEFLMLSKAYTGRELADLGVVNYAVPREQLDVVTNEMVERLLRRSAFVLAWTKRIANRRVAAGLNMGLDASAAYEMVSLLQLERSNFVDPLTLE